MSDAFWEVLAVTASVLGIVSFAITVWTYLWRKKLKDLHRDRWERFRFRRIRNALSWDHRSPPAMSSDDWHEVATSLGRRYEVEPMHLDGRAFPVTLLWANATRSIDPDALLGRLEDAPAVPRAPTPLRAFVKRELENDMYPRENTNYALRNVELDGPVPRIDAYLGLYYDNQVTQVGMERELYRALAARAPNEPIADIVARASALPIRAQVDAEAPSLTSGEGRSASLGVSTFFVFRQVDGKGADLGYSAAVYRRSSAVAVDSKHMHVIPAAMFECTYGYPRREWSIRNNVERELLEELYDYEEATRPRHLIPDGIAGQPVIAELRALEAKGACELSATGISCNLLTRQLEICTVLLIHDPGFVQRHPPRLNDEYDPGVTVPISELERYALNEAMTPAEIAMPGLAAIRLGLDWLRTARGIG